MNKNKCNCGRTIYLRRNSTIYAKACPSCQLFAATKKQRSKPQKSGRRKHPTPWRDKPTADMIIHVQEKIVNPYIRHRDNEVWNGKSISDNGRISDAGHYYSVGAKGGLRLCIQNIHGQSKSGNSYLFKGGDLINYRKGLVQRYGEYYVKELDHLAMISEGVKSLDRYNVILIAETYLYLRKNKIWVFRHVQFEKYKMELMR